MKQNLEDAVRSLAVIKSAMPTLEDFCNYSTEDLREQITVGAAEIGVSEWYHIVNAIDTIRAEYPTAELTEAIRLFKNSGPGAERALVEALRMERTR
jgi:hypothetical protein